MPREGKEEKNHVFIKKTICLLFAVDYRIAAVCCLHIACALFFIP